MPDLPSGYYLRPADETQAYVSLAVARYWKAGCLESGHVRFGGGQSEKGQEWHLAGCLPYKNLAEALDHVLLRKQRVLQAVARRLQAPETPALPTLVPEPVMRRRPPGQMRDAAIRRERRQARYEAVIEAYRQGQSLHSIARQQGVARPTVRKYVQSEGLPQPAARGPRPRKVGPFETYLRELWNAGERNSGALFRELRVRGYTGSESMLRDYLSD